MPHRLELPNSEVHTIAIKAANARTGRFEPLPPGDEYMVENSHPESLSATIVLNGTGAPALRLQPLVDEAEGVEVDVTNTAGFRTCELEVVIIKQENAKALELDMANTRVEPQSVPSTSPVQAQPGPGKTEPAGGNATVDPGVAVGGPAVVGPEKGEAPQTTAEPGAATTPGMQVQEPAGSQPQDEPQDPSAIHEGDDVQINKAQP